MAHSQKIMSMGQIYHIYSTHDFLMITIKRHKHASKPQKVFFSIKNMRYLWKPTWKERFSGVSEDGLVVNGAWDSIPRSLELKAEN